MTPKRKILLISVIFGLIFFSLIIFIIYPLLKEIKESSVELISAKKYLISSRDQTENINQIRKIYKEMEPDFKKIDNFFIDPEVPIDLIKFWEKMAADSEVLIKVSSVVLKTAETDPWKSMGFQLVLTGSFPHFSRFLEKIETGPYLIDIQNLNIKRLTEQDLQFSKYEQFSLGDVSATLMVKVFNK